MNGTRYNKFVLPKLFLLTYVLVFLIIFFIKDSSIFFIVNHNLMNKAYFLMIFLGIVINLFILICVSINTTNIKRLSIGIILFLLFLIPILLSTKLLSPVFFMALLMMLNARVIDPNRFIKNDFKMRLLFIILIIGLSLIHILPSREYLSKGVHHLNRLSFGFSGPNAFATIILATLLAYCLIDRKYHHRFIVSISVLFIIILTFILTDSITFGILSFIFIIIFVCNISDSYILQSIGNIISKALVLISIAFSTIVSILFIYNPNINDPFFFWLNNITSGRLMIQSRALMDYPIKLTGYLSMPLLGLNDENIDNFFVSNLLHCGVIGFLIIVIALLYLGVKSLRYGNTMTNICIVMITLSFMTIATDELYAPLIYISSLMYCKERNYKHHVKTTSK